MAGEVSAGPVATANGKAGAEDMLLTRQADTEAFHGRLERAQKLERRAIELAKHNGANETAAYDRAEMGLWEAEHVCPTETVATQL